MKIVEAANVLTPAYLAILSKGFSIRPQDNLMIAERDGDQFIAHDSLALLGLIGLAETRGEAWPASDAEIDVFIEQFGSVAD